MAVEVTAIRKVLDGAEASLKEALHDFAVGFSVNRLDNIPRVETALGKVQEATVELAQVK